MSISEPKCGKEITRNIEWSETQNCQTAHSRCPKGTDGKLFNLYTWFGSFIFRQTQRSTESYNSCFFVDVLNLCMF